MTTFLYFSFNMFKETKLSSRFELISMLKNSYLVSYNSLYVSDITNDEGIVIMFPIGYWEAPTMSDFDKELEKEYKDLEDYIKKNKGKGIEIKKQNNKVGDELWQKQVKR